MSRIKDENMNEKVTRLLKDLPKINAPTNFETELSRRINQEAQIKEKTSWFDKIFSPKLVPSAALAVTVVIILFLLKGTVGDVEDPFQIMPKLREEQITRQDQPAIISGREVVGEVKDQIDGDEYYNTVREKSKSKKETYRSDSNLLQASSINESSIERISVTASNYLPDQAVIMGGGLNYKIVRLDEEERREIEILREKIDISSENLRKN